MNAEIIAIGDELTSGQRIDTNSAWISQRLGEIGIRVLHHSTVADDMASCRDVFRTAFGRADLVICTGGLGPTADDLTREVIAEAMGVDLQQDDASLAHIRQMFESRGREMPPNNAIQAMFPAGSRIVPNPHGTAPGIDVDVPRVKAADSDDAIESSRCFALPGVPVEMKEMWANTVLPALLEDGAAPRVIVHHELKCFGIGESDCELRMPDIVRRGREPSVGITVHKATITLRITAEGADETECLAKIQPTVDTIRECLGSIVFAEGPVTLTSAVFHQLTQRNESLVTAEWGTPGILAGWLSDANRPSPTHQPANLPQVYRGGIVGQRLSLPGSSTVGVDTTSESELRDLVEQQRKQADADYGLAIGAWHVADASTANDASTASTANDAKAIPQAYIILAHRGAAPETRAIPYNGHPDLIPERTAKLALNMLRLHILAVESEI